MRVLRAGAQTIGQEKRNPFAFFDIKFRSLDFLERPFGAFMPRVNRP